MAMAMAMATVALLAVSSAATSFAEVPDRRLKEIYAMSPEKMAMTGAWTRANIDRLWGYLNAIKDPKVRALVLDMVNNPKSTVFNATAQKNAFRTMPAAGGPGHHYYPGGLAVHAVENIEIAFGWADMFARIHGVDNLNRDMVIATASYHFDPFWDVDKADGKEGLNAALAEAAKLAGVPAPKVDTNKRMAEWWLSVFSDGSWSFSHYIAGQFAHNWVREVAKDIGIDPKSAEANKLAWFVLTRLSDFKLYSLYQSSGFDANVVKKLILAVLKDSSAYEVPES
jgi:hypothetical protein